MARQRKRRISRTRRKAFKILMLIMTGLACTTIWLVGMRIKNSLPIYVQEPGHELTGHRYLYDERYGWKNIPGWQATTIGQPLSINSRGLRDREYSDEKPPGTRRILVLGDSYTWGYGVGDKEIYTEVLETLLQEKYPHYEIINAGVSGWGTDQQYLFLLQEGLNYSPDLVIVAHFINDLDEILQTESYGLQKPMFMVQDNKLVLYNSPVPRPSLRNTRNIQRKNPFLLTKHLLETMEHVCAQHNCQVMAMQFGTFIFPQQDDSRKLRALLTRFFPDLENIFYLDLDGEFAAAQLTADDLIGENRDRHWDANGHQKTAEILYRFLQENQLLIAK
ncbi:MAG: GDSL-type esterase/lipase family protein [Pirellulaceae bacterium]